MIINESWTFQGHTHILGVTAVCTADADLAPRKAHPVAEGHITHIRQKYHIYSS